LFVCLFVEWSEAQPSKPKAARTHRLSLSHTHATSSLPVPSTFSPQPSPSPHTRTRHHPRRRPLVPSTPTAAAAAAGGCMEGGSSSSSTVPVRAVSVCLPFSLPRPPLLPLLALLPWPPPPPPPSAGGGGGGGSLVSPCLILGGCRDITSTNNTTIKTHKSRTNGPHPSSPPLVLPSHHDHPNPPPQTLTSPSPPFPPPGGGGGDDDDDDDDEGGGDTALSTMCRDGGRGWAEKEAAATRPSSSSTILARTSARNSWPSRSMHLALLLVGLLNLGWGWGCGVGGLILFLSFIGNYTRAHTHINKREREACISSHKREKDTLT
jgi:hypothetical protein